jgi:ABC-2 type transport system ATP-binding protein
MMLILKNILKKYNGVSLLTIPDFYLKNGIYWLKGANGSGKSTLLKIIAGLIPFAGTVLYDGIDLIKEPVTFKRQISYHPADANLPPFIIGMELIQFYDAVRNPHQQSEVGSIIEQFELTEFVNNKSGSYSSGMRKRLSLALAFMGAPRLIMLDEPLTALDTSVTKLITGQIEKAGAGGACLIITSHQDFEYKNVGFTGILEIENAQLLKR